VGPVTFTYSPLSSGSTFPVGVTTVTVTATDNFHNSSSTSFTVAITDLPVITSISPNRLVNATGPLGATVTYIAATATDPISAVTLTYSQGSGTTFAPGTTTVIVTAMNAAHNTTTGTFTVRVRDIPVITSVSPNLVMEATGPTGAVVTYVAATATGVAPPSPVLSYSYSTAGVATLFPLGTTTVTVTATSASGDTATKSFTVLVHDTTPPVLGPVSGNLTVEATSAAGATVSYATPAATDAVGPVTIVYSQRSGTVFALGTTTVTVYAVDGAGNQSQSQSFTILVQDTTPPAITSISGNLVIPAASAAGAIVNYAAAIATDAVGPVTIIYNLASGTFFPIGTTVVTVTAFDGAGNWTSQWFTVTVMDVPVITFVSPTVTVPKTSAAGAIVTYLPAMATDPASLVSLTYSQPSGTLFPIGTTMVTVTATNAALNVVTMTFMVVVLP
jgi:hypothetical protein